jgi:signal transduction histidine kinase
METLEAQPRLDTNASLQGYRTALQSYLRGAGEHALQTAYDIGRGSLASGVGLLEVSRLHHAALSSLLQSSAEQDHESIVAAAGEFYSECISPYEMTYGAFRETNAVLRHFNDVLEQEAKRIADALHDEAGQLLVAVYIALENLAQELPVSRSRVSEMTALLDQIEVQLRRLSHELAPALLNDLGLTPALRYLAEGLSQRSKLAFEIEAEIGERLPSNVESVLYRIAQESLSNVLKHAQASKVSICIAREPDGVRCVIRDDGIGFDLKAVAARGGEQGFGLKGMHERLRVLGGEMYIHTAPNAGTELVAHIPLEN